MEATWLMTFANEYHNEDNNLVVSGRWSSWYNKSFPFLTPIIIQEIWGAADSKVFCNNHRNISFCLPSSIQQLNTLLRMPLLLTMEHYSANDKIIFVISMDSSGNNIQQDFTIWCHFSFRVLWEKDIGREKLRKNVFKKTKEKEYFCVILSNLEFHSFLLSYSIWEKCFKTFFFFQMQSFDKSQCWLKSKRTK